MVLLSQYKEHALDLYNLNNAKNIHILRRTRPILPKSKTTNSDFCETFFNTHFFGQKITR